MTAEPGPGAAGWQRYGSGYRDARYAPDPGRDAVWRAIVEDLEARFIPGAATVLDLGCGYGGFVNHARARRRLAVDLDDVAAFLAPGVELVRGSATDLSWLADGAVDVVFSSNLLEHLDRSDGARAVAEAHRVLRPGGRLALVQPNFRLCYDRYWDDYTHQTPYTDESLCGLLAASGFTIQHRRPGYLPFSMRSRLPRSYWLTRLYLAAGSPVGGRQMLVVGEKGGSCSTGSG